MGIKKFYLKTYGCKLNQTDSDLIRRILSKNFKEENSENKANFVIINSCGVVEKTERKIIKKILELKKKNKKIILTGCLPLISLGKVNELVDGILGPKNLSFLPIVVKRVLAGRKSIFLKRKQIDKARFFCFKDDKKDNQKCIKIIPISEGCLGNCSYCATKFSRGKLKSFEMKNILKAINIALQSGFKEIQLTSQDLGIYGLDKGEFLLPKLLRKISEIEGDFRVRLGMMNPWVGKKIFNNLISILKKDKFYKFLHLPVESGDDQILKRMKRPYKVKEFIYLVKKFRKNFKYSLLATDIICGFPKENEKSFKNTLNLIREIKPEILHVFRFSKRPGTEATKFKDLLIKLKKERSRILTKEWERINLLKNKKFIGKEFPVLITEKRKKAFLARMNSYRAVILKDIKKGKVGEWQKVKIVGAKTNYLIGELL